MNNDALMEINNLSFSYNKERIILKDINLKLGPGEVFCIVGPNGCGKSTLLDCILRLNKLQSGSITVAGKNALDMKPHEYASFVSYVPQGHHPTFSYTVLQMVAMGGAFRQKLISGITADEYETARQAIKTVGLSHLIDRDYTTLSGGELQLVLIARALASKTKILIMDEPTAHLDFRHELQVMELIAKLVKEDGLSIIMATHFLNQAYFLENAGVQTTVGLINNATFEIRGKPSEVLIPDNLEKTFNIMTEIATDKTGSRQYILSLHNKKYQE